MNAIKLFFGAVAVVGLAMVGLMLSAFPYAIAIVMAVLLLRAFS